MGPSKRLECGVCIFLIVVKLKWTIVALTMLWALPSPAKNYGAFCLFRACVSCLLKSNWTTFPYSCESLIDFDSSDGNGSSFHAMTQSLSISKL